MDLEILPDARRLGGRMMLSLIRMMIVSIGVFAFCATAHAQEPQAPPADLQLSEEIQALIQAEMREIAGAGQAIVMALVTGDWKSIQRTSEQIRASYVMERNLSESQRRELESALPDHFKRLDMEFHARAKSLGDAAASADLESVAFHYSRMLETCATCHSLYAGSRFPGFSSAASGQ